MGVDARGFPGGTPEAQSHLCVCQASFLMTFATGGVPHSGPQHLMMIRTDLKLGTWLYKAPRVLQVYGNEENCIRGKRKRGTQIWRSLPKRIILITLFMAMTLGFKRHMHVDSSLALPTLWRQPCLVSLPLLFKWLKVKNPGCKARFSKSKINSWLEQMFPKLMVNKCKVPKGQKLEKKYFLMVSAGKFSSVHLTQVPSN